jgi:hypothetical protein
MFYRNQSHNPVKHALMPDTYPWEILMSDTAPTGTTGWVETTEEEMTALRASLDTEFQAYLAALAQEQAIEQAKIDGMNEIRSRIAFFDDMIIKFNFENAIMGITLEESVSLLTKVGGIQAAGKAGALETALAGWMQLTTDRILTEERIVSYGQALADRVGMALPDRP